MTSTRACRSCLKDHVKTYQAENPEKVKAWKKADRLRNIEAERERTRRYRATHPDRKAQSNKDWFTRNIAKRNAYAAKRNAAKLNATPPWADLEKIAAFYLEAERLTRETGIEHQVDHIFPLQGKLCCGLHVETNLQILTKEDNVRKNNRMPAYSTKGGHLTIL